MSCRMLDSAAGRAEKRHASSNSAGWSSSSKASTISIGRTGAMLAWRPSRANSVYVTPSQARLRKVSPMPETTALAPRPATQMDQPALTHSARISARPSPPNMFEVRSAIPAAVRARRCIIHTATSAQQNAAPALAQCPKPSHPIGLGRPPPENSATVAGTALIGRLRSTARREWSGAGSADRGTACSSWRNRDRIRACVANPRSRHRKGN